MYGVSRDLVEERVVWFNWACLSSSVSRYNYTSFLTYSLRTAYKISYCPYGVIIEYNHLFYDPGKDHIGIVRAWTSQVLLQRVQQSLLHVRRGIKANQSEPILSTAMRDERHLIPDTAYPNSGFNEHGDWDGVVQIPDSGAELRAFVPTMKRL
jgi:hypothetical protein